MNEKDRKALQEGVGEVLRLASLPEEEARKEIARHVDFDEDDLDTFHDCGMW